VAYLDANLVFMKLLFGWQVLSALLMIHVSSWGQESAVQISVGYGIPVGTQQIYSNYQSNAQGQITRDGTYSSYGAGLNFGISYAHMSSENVGYDVALSYLVGTSVNGHDNDVSASVANLNSAVSSASAFFLSPSIVVRANKRMLTPYVKSGLLIGLVSIEEEVESSYTSPGSVGVASSKREYRGGLPIGLKGAFGFQFGAGDEVRYFMELQYTNMTYYPGESELTYFWVNNNNMLPTLPVSDVKTVYRDTLTSTAGSTPSPSQPTSSLSIAMPMSSLLLSVGMRFLIGAKR
jgi:hypothetical protein